MCGSLVRFFFLMCSTVLLINEFNGGCVQWCVVFSGVLCSVVCCVQWCVVFSGVLCSVVCCVQWCVFSGVLINEFNGGC